MSRELAAIAVLAVVHFAAFGVLMYAMLDGDSAGWRGWWPRDEPPEDPAPPPGPAPLDGGLPLPDATPASARLRGPGRLGYRRGRPRRPEHPPEPARPRQPV